MSRSGYNEDCDSNYLYLYRGMIERAIKGKRSQKFLRELAKAMDDMPVKRLIQCELISSTGEVCAIGAYCKAKNIDVSGVDIEDREEVGGLVDISGSLAAEIEYMNDEVRSGQTPEERWKRMRAWVSSNLIDEAKAKLLEEELNGD